MSQRRNKINTFKSYSLALILPTNLRYKNKCIQTYINSLRTDRNAWEKLTQISLLLTVQFKEIEKLGRLDFSQSFFLNAKTNTVN